MHVFLLVIILSLFSTLVGANPTANKPSFTQISRAVYKDQLEGFWLGQSLANWTGLVTEMDKVGGPGVHGKFYTREDWGTTDLPSIWGQGVPSNLSKTIDWVIVGPEGVWGADDDTDIEYMYQYLLAQHQATVLTPEQIRNGWLTHIYSEQNTPFRTPEGAAENYLWVSNQRAHELMQSGILPPDTSAPEHNEHFEMIDAQLTTEIFGLYAPTRPDVALTLAHLPIRTTARENAAWAAEFYVIMHALAATLAPQQSPKKHIHQLAEQARKHLPNESYAAAMFDFVKSQYSQGKSWEEARDGLYQRYQIEQRDGYDMTSRKLYCNGCFASGINFGASIISLLYGEGDFKSTVKIAVLCGWDSDNPAATWGGLLGFILGKQALEGIFEQEFSSRFNIHRTRGNFPNDGIDNFSAMADVGVSIVDRVVEHEMGGHVTNDYWFIPAVMATSE